MLNAEAALQRVWTAALQRQSPCEAEDARKGKAAAAGGSALARRPRQALEVARRHPATAAAGSVIACYAALRLTVAGFHAVVTPEGRPQSTWIRIYWPLGMADLFGAYQKPGSDEVEVDCGHDDTMHIVADLVLPTRVKRWRGALLNVPADVEGTLERRYGKGWRTPAYMDKGADAVENSKPYARLFKLLARLLRMPVFLSIEIGDREAFRKQLDAHQRALDCFESLRIQYGWPVSLAELDGEQREILAEAYASDPAWSAKGAAALDPPAPLHAGRLVIVLHEKEAPKACANFKALCTGEKGVGKASGKPLHYKGVRLHRIVSGFIAQGGDVVKGDGSGGDSIYGGKFNDEKAALKLKHDAPGVVGMANSGKNSNTSQFYLTLAAAPACDGKHVVIGRVVEGLEVLQRIDAEAASAGGEPRVEVMIADCGVLS
eukprot:scaffold25.g5119.t1